MGKNNNTSTYEPAKQVITIETIEGEFYITTITKGVSESGHTYEIVEKVLKKK